MDRRHDRHPPRTEGVKKMEFIPGNEEGAFSILKSDYLPRGFNTGPCPIQGPEFGLKLSSEDRADLIAYLKTLSAVRVEITQS